MNREIKFRAWCPNLKSMSRSINLYTHPPLQLSFRGDFGLSQHNLSNKYIVMQYTGLKDKNGVEIYEGDVVIADERGNERFAYYKIHYDKIYCSWVGWFIRNHTSSNDNHNKPLGELRFNITVKGNIHEHPELLEQGE